MATWATRSAPAPPPPCDEPASPEPAEPTKGPVQFSPDQHRDLGTLAELLRFPVRQAILLALASGGETHVGGLAACGLPWEDACLKPQDNERKVETLSVYQARQPISGGSVKGWKRHEKDLAPMLDELRKLGLVTD